MALKSRNYFSMFSARKNLLSFKETTNFQKQFCFLKISKKENFTNRKDLIVNKEFKNFFKFYKINKHSLTLLTESLFLNTTLKK